MEEKILVVAANLQRIRLAQRLSQEQLARASGVDTRTIQRMERGTVVARADTIVRVAAALGTTPDELEKEPPPDPSVKATARFETVTLTPVRSGRDLVALLLGRHATSFEEIDIEMEADLDAIAKFQQEVYEYGDILSDLGPSERRTLEKSLDESLGGLREMGLHVAGTARTYRLQGGVMDGAAWRITYVVVARREVSSVLRDTHRPVM